MGGGAVERRVEATTRYPGNEWFGTRIVCLSNELEIELTDTLIRSIIQQPPRLRRYPRARSRRYARREGEVRAFVDYLYLRTFFFLVFVHVRKSMTKKK